jgi:hypothetical protein
MSLTTIRVNNPTGAAESHYNLMWQLHVPAEPVSEHDVDAALVDDIVLTFKQHQPRLTIEVLDDATPADEEQQAE